MAMNIRKYSRTAEVPTASMADIAFLLIIFFMLTAVYSSTRGLEFAFPKDDPQQRDVQPQEAIHVKIVGDKQFVVDRTPMTIEQMAGYVDQKMQEVPDKPVIIHALPDVPYYSMIDAFDVLKRLEVQNISIPTQTEIERWRALGVNVFE
jgi:biopolymer transport protein ExbD